MNVLIIEDEKPAAERISRLLKKVDTGIDIVATFETVKIQLIGFKIIHT